MEACDHLAISSVEADVSASLVSLIQKITSKPTVGQSDYLLRLA